MLSTPKLKELPRPKLELKLPLLGAIMLPSLIRFRSTVAEKWSRNIFTHNCTCSDDDLYHTYTKTPKRYVHISVGIYDGFYHVCTFKLGPFTKLKELPRPKFGLKLPLLDATIPIPHYGVKIISHTI